MGVGRGQRQDTPHRHPRLPVTQPSGAGNKLLLRPPGCPPATGQPARAAPGGADPQPLPAQGRAGTGGGAEAELRPCGDRQARPAVQLPGGRRRAGRRGRGAGRSVLPRPAAGPATRAPISLGHSPQGRGPGAGSGPLGSGPPSRGGAIGEGRPPLPSGPPAPARRDCPARAHGGSAPRAQGACRGRALAPKLAP